MYVSRNVWIEFYSSACRNWSSQHIVSISFYFICMSFACLYIYTADGCLVPTEAKSGHPIPSIVSHMDSGN